MEIITDVLQIVSFCGYLKASYPLFAVYERSRFWVSLDSDESQTLSHLPTWSSSECSSIYLYIFSTIITSFTTFFCYYHLWFNLILFWNQYSQVKTVSIMLALLIVIDLFIQKLVSWVFQITRHCSRNLILICKNDLVLASDSMITLVVGKWLRAYL